MTMVGEGAGLASQREILGALTLHGYLRGSNSETGIIDTMDQIDQTVSPGTIYPLPSMMAKKGLLRRITPVWDPRQVNHAITDRGEVALALALGFLEGALSGW